MRGRQDRAAGRVAVKGFIRLAAAVVGPPRQRTVLSCARVVPARHSPVDTKEALVAAGRLCGNDGRVFFPGRFQN